MIINLWIFLTDGAFFWTNLSQFLLFLELIVLHEFLVAFVGDVILSNGCRQVDTIVQIPTPKDIVMWFKGLSLLIETEYYSLAFSLPLLHVRVHTPGNTILLQMSAKSWFRSTTLVWWAAKWEHTKHRDVEWSRKRMATPPLLPVVPDIPVFTDLTATSLKRNDVWMYFQKWNGIHVHCSYTKMLYYYHDSPITDLLLLLFPLKYLALWTTSLHEDTVATSQIML
jgi:hypothetical protein